MFARLNRAGQAHSERTRLRARLFIQALESRHAPATFTVNTLTDTGAGSGLAGDLRYCINQANAASGADTITFALGGPATITLNGTQLPVLSDTTGATTIAGPGANSLTIDAKQKSRIFQLNSGVEIAIDGVTITNGKASYDGGGILTSMNCIVTLSNSNIVNNSSAFGGGGIYCRGTLTVLNAVIQGNTAAGFYGGGIYHQGTLIVSDTAIKSNWSSEEGGGVYCEGTLNVANSSIVNNSASVHGGGIAIFKTTSTAVINNSTFQGNATTLDGGGLFCFAGSATVTSSTFTGNKANNQGGGIGARANAIVTINNSTFYSNLAYSGGGMSCVLTSLLTVKNSTINGNSAGFGGGGGIYTGSNGMVNLSNAVVAGNSSSSVPDIYGTFSQTNSLVNMSAAAAGLGSLGNYGGPTATIPLLPGSPAIDKGATVVGITTDQRGIARPQGAAFDIGAFEYVFNPSLVVTTAVDEDNGTSDPAFGTGTSLREAISYANAHAGADSITFALGGPATITLGGTGLTVSDAVAIQGPGANQLTVSGNYKSGIFQFSNNFFGTRISSISGATLTKGTGTSYFGTRGGAIFNRHGNDLTVSLCELHANSASNGGGIRNDAMLTITNSVFSGNSAANGGGIDNNGTLIVTNSTISGNSASNVGGGIYNIRTLTVNGSTLSGNSADEGGAIDNFGSLAVTNSIVIGNSATNGGGIQSFFTFSLSNSTVTGNSASNCGGGIRNGSTLMLSYSTISGNSATSGGAIDNFGSLTVTNSTLSANSASNGGAIDNFGPLSVTNSTLNGNSAISGGAIHNFDILSVTNSALSGNSASNGGAIQNFNKLTVTNSTFNGNSASNGGGIQSLNTVILANSTLIANSANNGGGIFAGTNSQVNVSNSTLSGNAAGNDGGGVYASIGAPVTLINSTLSGNSAGIRGGALRSTGGNLTLTNSTLSGNSAGTRGGGIYNLGALTLTNSTLSGNSASISGGGINSHGAVIVINSTLSANSAGQNAGGIRNYNTLSLGNSIVAGNGAPNSPDIYGNFSQTKSLINQSAAAVGLGTLGNYGGPTATIPLLPGSPAIDAGGSTTLTMDQRGKSYFGKADIGAFESQGFVVSTTGSGQSVPLNITFGNPLVVIVTAKNSVEPVDDGVVMFMPPATGASATLSGTVVTISGGKASVTATANGIAGIYAVTATSGSLSASFQLTNGGPPNMVSLNFVGGNLSVSFGNQGNFIEVFGQTGAVTVRSNYTVVGTYAVTGIITVGGGSGADTFTLTVNSGAAFPSLVTVNAVGGDDVVRVGSSGVTPGTIPNLTLNLGEGNNKVIDNGLKITKSWTMNAGNGNDTFGPLMSPVGTLLTINAGNGDNTASIFSKVGSQVRYNGGAGKDNVTVGGLNSYNLLVHLGAGNDTFTFNPGSSIGNGFIDFGADADVHVPNGVFVGSGLTILNLP